MSMHNVPTICPECGNVDPARMQPVTASNFRTKGVSLLAVKCGMCGHEEPTPTLMPPDKIG